MEGEQEHPLVVARAARNLTQQELAKKVKLSPKTIWAAENNLPISAHSRQQLCKYFRTNAEMLGLVSVTRNTPARNKKQSETVFSSPPTFMGATKDHLLPSPLLANGQRSITDVSDSTIENLVTITQEYRSLQPAGFATEDGLRSHISLIQNALENTVNNKTRSELWRILAQSQLLARHSITKTQELGRARTWNEAAIASARYSGDTLLLGAAIGHLGHFYLTWQHDPFSAGKLLNQAQEYTRGHPVNGWFAIVAAAIAAEQENHDECETSVARATAIFREMPTAPEYADLYYTDFNSAGIDAFAGNSLLKVGEPNKALERLTSIDLEKLAENRHASAFYGIACAYAAIGELEAMQIYAFRSIDKALATNRLYILPRFNMLVQKLQAKNRHEAHAAAIAAYAHVALHQ